MKNRRMPAGNSHTQKGENVTKERQGFQPYVRTTMLISLGFFTMGLMDPLYDNFVPLFLRNYISSMSVRNIVITLDNVFALILIPIVSVWSDRTRTRVGRRMPFILVTLPLSAILFAFIPYSAAASLLALILMIVVLNLFKQGARGPIVALMPDTIPGEYRSEANGIINMAGAAAGIIATLVLGPLMNVDLNLPVLGSTKDRLPFVLAGVLVIFSVILLYVFVKEKRSDGATGSEMAPLVQSLKTIAKAEDKSALLILVSIFLWFFAYQGILPTISTYMLDVIGVSTGQTSFAMGAAAVAMVVFAAPSGYLAHRLGRKHVIRFCLMGMAIVFVAAFFHQPATLALHLSKAATLFSFLGLMFLFGGFWVAIVANSFPMLWQMASFANVGVFTAAYYVAKESSSIIAPPITGGVADLFGIRWIFIVAGLFMVAAFFVMGLVRSGEAHDKYAAKAA
jgi:MFS family permease